MRLSLLRYPAWLLSVSFAVPFALASTPAALPKADSTVPTAYSGPVRINLSGNWDFRFDPEGQGENGAWFAPAVKGPWEKAAVPGSFNYEFARHPNPPNPDDTSLFYKGKVWYRTQFIGPRTPHSDIFLHLSGTVLRQKVWLNGILIGSSVLPWLDVSYNVTNLLARGQENTLVIEVDNSILPDAIPDTKWRGWWDDGGLIWPVYLEKRQAVRSDSYVTTTMQPGGKWRLQVNTDVHEDRPAGAELALTLTDSQGKTVWQKTRRVPASSGPLQLMTSTMLSAVHPWSPDHPVLYRLTVRAQAEGQTADVTSFRIGFRQIETRGSRIFLNGMPLLLRGINRHEFAPGVGQSVSVAQNRRDMEQIRALGGNFVRLAHYSQSQDVYDDCDELGLLVWNEIPAWQSSASTLASPAVWQNYAQPELEATIRQHRNHPSVVIWSVANEIPSNTPEGAAYVAKAIAYVHRLDPTRLATFASDKREKDLAMGPVDVVSVNEYFGWYYGKLDDVGPMLDRMHAKYPDKPIVVSEFGSESVAHWDRATAQDGSKDYSYAYQARFLKAHLEQIYAPQRSSYVAGGVIWIYNDFPDPHRINGDHPDMAKYRNSKGLVTINRQPKPAFAVVRNFYHRLADETDSASGEVGH